MQTEVFIILIEKYLSGKATPEEIQLLEEYYERWGNKKFQFLSQEKANSLKQELLSALNEKMLEEVNTPVVSIRRKLIRYSAVAAILLLIIGGYWMHESPKTEDKSQIELVQIDVEAPKTNKAMITLSDGRKIALDSLNNGTLAVQGNVQVMKNAKGEIVYHGKNEKEEMSRDGKQELVYNTLYNPRGSTVVFLTLQDGTKVWLNAESSLRYPIVFNGDYRQVEIKGEAYFEVVHNSKKPFRVKLTDGSTIQDIGTGFNVNAYPEIQKIQTTLIEGSLKVNNTVLKPGEQYSDGKINKDIDTDEVIAWKEGKFQFTGKTEIETIMNQISRWYTVEVEYNGKIEKHFWGTMSRSVNVVEVLKMLQATGSVHFKIDKNKIIVMP